MIARVIVILIYIVWLSGCTTYGGKLFWENKIKPTPYIDGGHRVKPSSWDEGAVTYSWLGHTTVLLNIYGTEILTDPVLLDRIGPPEIFDNLFGIKRLVKLPLQLKDLKDIDLVLVSHPHFDHLDLASLDSLNEVTSYRLVVPALNKQLLSDDLPDIIELDWAGRAPEVMHYENLTIRAFRVEHYGYAPWGERDVKRGFNGYLISTDDKAGKQKHVAFFGDTSYLRYRDDTGDMLKKPLSIDWRKKFPSSVLRSGIDLCIIPIGDSTYYWNHISPQNAVTLSEELNCRKLLPVHYATFLLTPPEEEAEPPRQQLIKSLREKGAMELINCNDDAHRQHFPDIGVSCILP